MSDNRTDAEVSRDAMLYKMRSDNNTNQPHILEADLLSGILLVLIEIRDELRKKDGQP